MRLRPTVKQRKEKEPTQQQIEQAGVRERQKELAERLARIEAAVRLRKKLG